MWATRHIERRLLRFVLTPWNLAVSITNVKNNAIVNAPWLYYMYSPHCVKAIGVPVRQWQLWAHRGCWYIHTAWGFTLVVLLLDIQALPEPQGVGASDSAGLHAFFLSS